MLALVALLAGVVVSGLGRSGLHQRREQTMLALHAELMRARVRAMRNAAPAELRVSWLDERSRIAVPSFDPSEQQALRIEHVAAPAASGEGDSNAPVRTRTVEALGMVAFDQQGQPFDSLAIAFNASGRTRARAWLFAVQRPGGAARAAAGSGAVPGGAIGGADTLFTISFDPVSGAPLLHGADESPDFAGSLSTDGSTAP